MYNSNSSLHDYYDGLSEYTGMCNYGIDILIILEIILGVFAYQYFFSHN